MKIGFELFKTRTLEEKIDIAALEEKYEIYLPDLYKLFISTFHPEIKKSSLNYEVILYTILIADSQDKELDAL